jgi:hypothetical protein
MKKLLLLGGALTIAAAMYILGAQHPFATSATQVGQVPAIAPKATTKSAVAFKGDVVPEPNSAPLNVYRNAKFGYTVCYPASFEARPERPDGGARVFRDANGAKLTTSGEYNTDDLLLSDFDGAGNDEMEMMTLREEHPGYKILAGYNDATRYWRKVFLRDDVFTTVELRYPRNQAGVYAPIIRQLNACTSAGKPAF